MRIEKAHTLSRRTKNVKKRTKAYEKRILCKFTFKLIYCNKSKIKIETIFLRKQETRRIQELLQQTMRQSKLSNLFNFVRNRIETQPFFEPLNAI